MNVTSAKYKTSKTENDSIIAVINGITVYVPIEPKNREYIAIQKWVAEGNTIEEAD